MSTLKPRKRLSLGRDTLARLSAPQLAAVNGGDSVLIRCGITRTCPGCCFSKGDDTCPSIAK